jgi:hypothetical protein
MTVKNQLKLNHELINKKLANDILKIPEANDLFYATEDGKTISGKILKIENLKYFSTKFHKALSKLNRLIWGKKGAKTAFIYSNLVKVGIELFEEILKQNGYLEYQDVYSNYQIQPDTVCYYCGNKYKDHDKLQFSKAEFDSDSDTSTKTKNNKSKSDTSSDTESESDLELENDDSTDYNQYKAHITTKYVPQHDFRPATFISVTGKPSEESAEFVPEDKQRKQFEVFNNYENREGMNIKFVLGSKVMNEGISLKHVGEVHILDVYFNLGKVDQTVGRAIRHCSHYKLMSEVNKYPFVNVYKYVVSVETGLSTEEELYQKAEQKYMLIKKMERAMKEIAIDCPLNSFGNMFAEEMEKYEKCGEPGQLACPTICDYTKCHYKCADFKLNSEYYDPSRRIYKKISRDNLDYSTFTHSLARSEIDYAKKKIKEMYIKTYVYSLENIMKYIKNTYDEDKRDLFDEFFIFKALDELIPVTENDFNNFRDTILDKYNRQGYLIYLNKYYIFQPFDQNEDVPMYYRTTFDKQVTQKLTLYNYLKNTDKYVQYKSGKQKKLADSKLEGKDQIVNYDFDSVMEYYDGRDENFVVGIIDRESSRRKNQQNEEIKDAFKLRGKRSKILEKRRGTGIQQVRGATCHSSYDKEYLESVVKKLGIIYNPSDIRTTLCDRIKDRLFELEKYSKGTDKITYLMVPKNHQTIPFPLNIEDRVAYTINKLKENIKFKLDITTEEVKLKTGSKELPHFEIKIIIKNSDKLKEYVDYITREGGEKVKNDWIILVK